MKRILLVILFCFISSSLWGQSPGPSGDITVSEITDIDTTYLGIDGSNANQDIDIGANDFQGQNITATDNATVGGDLTMVGTLDMTTQEGGYSSQLIKCSVSNSYYPERLASMVGVDTAIWIFDNESIASNYNWLVHANLSASATYATAFGIGLHGEGQIGTLYEQSSSTNTNGEGAMISMVDKKSVSDPGELPWITVMDRELNDATHTYPSATDETLFKLDRNGDITSKTKSNGTPRTGINLINLITGTSFLEDNEVIGILSQSSLNGSTAGGNADNLTIRGAKFFGATSYLGALSAKKIVSMTFMPTDEFAPWGGSITAADTIGAEFLNRNGVTTGVTNQTLALFEKPSGATNNVQIKMLANSTGTQSCTIDAVPDGTCSGTVLVDGATADLCGVCN